MASHISAVSAVRTERALVRAASRQLRIEDGLSASKVRKSTTESPSVSLYLAWYASTAPEDSRALSHSVPVSL